MSTELENNKVLAFFKELSNIPRESGNEKAVSDYLVQFGKDRHLETIQDEENNVIIKMPASPGCEDKPSLILQGHIDMVCEKLHDSNHDFAKDPIANIVDGEWLHADGTTLGADNGMGVAMAMAVLDDPTIEHGPITALFTTSEETGMNGAAGLKKGLVEGQYMLNIDTEVEDEFIVSCAGGVHVIVDIPLLRENTMPGYNKGLTITVQGLLGGHSGLEIHKQRGNANQILARLLHGLSKDFSYDLASFTGGTKHNAIPNKATAVISIREEDIVPITAWVKEFETGVKTTYAVQDPDLAITVATCEAPEVTYAGDTTEALISYLFLAEDGVHTMSQSIKGLVETSNNLAVVKEVPHALQILISIRSSNAVALEYLKEKMLRLADVLGITARATDGYPAWEYEPGSALETQAIAIYEEVTGKKPAVNAVHAGLECGLLKAVLPDTQMISFGPTITGAHTPYEKAHIPSIHRMYHYLVTLIQKLK